MNPISRRLFHQVFVETAQSPRARPSRSERINNSAQPSFEKMPRSASSNENFQAKDIQKELIPYTPPSTDLYIPSRQVALAPVVPKIKALAVSNKDARQAKVASAQREIIKKMITHNLFVVPEDKALIPWFATGLDSVNKALMCIETPANQDLHHDFFEKYESKILELLSTLFASLLVTALLAEDAADSQQILEDQKNLIGQVVQDVTSAIEDLEKIVAQTNSQSESLIKQIEDSSLPESEKSKMKNQINESNQQMITYLENQKGVLSELKAKCQQIQPEEIRHFASNQTRDMGTTILCALCGLNLPVSVLTSITVSALSDTSMNKAEAIAKYQKFLNQVKSHDMSVPNRQIIDGIIDGAMWGLTDKLLTETSKIHSSAALTISVKVLEGLISNKIKNETNPTLSKSELQEMLQSGDIKKLKDELIQANREAVGKIQGFVSVTQQEYNDYLKSKQEELKTRIESRWTVASAVNSFFGRFKDLW